MNFKKFTRAARQLLPLRYCGAVIVAAGTASRMGGIDKIRAPLGGKTVLENTVSAFENCEAIKQIVIVTREDLVEQVRELCNGFAKVTCVVAGGADRQGSVANGLAALSKEVELVAVHDGARPLVSFEVIDRTVRAAHSYGAAAPVVPVKDTIKVEKSGLVESTPDRSKLRAVQTPQVFDVELLRYALKKAATDKLAVTDDCSAVEHLGFPIRLVEGDERNIKITTPLDLKIAEVFMEDMR